MYRLGKSSADYVVSLEYLCSFRCACLAEAIESRLAFAEAIAKAGRIYQAV
jgi:hypothetical protein